MAKYNTELQETFFIIHLPDVFNPAAIEQMELLMKSTWLESIAETHVFDFKEVTDFQSEMYRVFVQYKQLLRARQKEFVSIHVSTPILRRLTTDGMITVINPVADLAEATRLIQSKKPKPVINTDFINPFIQGTRLTLEMQGKTKVEIGKPRLKPNHEAQKSETSIAAILNLDAEVFQGSIVLSFPKAVFLKIYQNMFDEVHPEITPEIQDCAGELLNILFGLAKSELNNKKGFSIKKAIPTVITGAELEFPKTQQSKMAIQIPFTTDAGVFYLEIHFGPF